MVDVIFSYTHENDPNFSSGTGRQRCTAILPPWGGIDGPAAAEAIMADLFTAAHWRNLVGGGTDLTVLFRVHAPPAIAGDYIVELRRVTKAAARRQDA